MKTKHILKYAGSALLVWAGGTSTAFAAGADTNAGVDVINTATVDYSVNSTPQAQQQDTDTFETDRLVNFVVEEVGYAANGALNANADDGNVLGTPGSTQYLYYRITNLTNGPIDIEVDFDNESDGFLGFGADVDDADTTNNNVFRDVGVIGTFEAGTDTGVGTFTSVPEDGVVYVWVQGDMGTEADGAIAVGTLLATAREAGGGAVLTETGSETALGIDNVLNDGAGERAGDNARDGTHSDKDVWEWQNATVVVTKTSTLVSDPINGTTDPRRIPGAIIEYCIDVDNSTGSAAADSIVIGDDIPANTTFVSGSIRSAATGTGTACDLASGTVEDDDADDSTGAGAPTDETNPDGGNHDGGTPGTVTITTPTIAAGARYKALFRVTID